MLSRRKTNRKEGPMEKNINDMPEEEKVEKSETEEETVEDTNETVET